MRSQFVLHLFCSPLNSRHASCGFFETITTPHPQQCSGRPQHAQSSPSAPSPFLQGVCTPSSFIDTFFVFLFFHLFVWNLNPTADSVVLVNSEISLEFSIYPKLDSVDGLTVEVFAFAIPLSFHHPFFFFDFSFTTHAPQPETQPIGRRKGIQ